MSELVTPPWDLCGFDRDFDPYSWERRSFTVRWLWWEGPRVEMSVEPTRDPNARDGEWREFAFMPHVAVEYDEQAVPLYHPVAVALARERVARAAAG